MCCWLWFGDSWQLYTSPMHQSYAFIFLLLTPLFYKYAVFCVHRVTDAAVWIVLSWPGAALPQPLFTCTQRNPNQAFVPSHSHGASHPVHLTVTLAAAINLKCAITRHEVESQLQRLMYCYSLWKTNKVTNVWHAILTVYCFLKYTLTDNYKIYVAKWWDLNQSSFNSIVHYPLFCL